MIPVSVQGQQQAERQRIAALKAACAAQGIHEGPAHPMMPGEIRPGDFRRPLITEGHEAPSPGHGPPHQMPHIDLTGSRGVVRPVRHFPPTPPLPGGHQS